MKKLKVFVSQPMAHRSDDEIRETISEVWKQLQKAYFDHDVKIIKSVAPKWMQKVCCPLWHLSRSIILMCEADLVYFAHGWEDARGCRIENACAIEYGKACFYEDHNVIPDDDDDCGHTCQSCRVYAGDEDVCPCCGEEIE